MSLLIDCYNVLHTGMPQSLAGLEEYRLCELLSMSPWTRQSIVVVCDGSVKPGGLSSSPFAEVSLIYSGRNRSADCVIVDMVNRSSTPRQVTVVTNDRTIQKDVRTRRARVMTTERFIENLASVAARSGGGAGTHSAAKPDGGDLSDDEVQRWMDAFGFEGDTELPKDDWTKMLDDWESELD